MNDELDEQHMGVVRGVRECEHQTELLLKSDRLPIAVMEHLVIQTAVTHQILLGIYSELAASRRE